MPEAPRPLSKPALSFAGAALITAIAILAYPLMGHLTLSPMYWIYERGPRHDFGTVVMAILGCLAGSLPAAGLQSA